MRTASAWKANASMSVPVPAMSHAVSAPATPVAWAKVLGSEKTPAPTIDPTTIADIVKMPSFTPRGGATELTVSESVIASPR